MPKKTTTRKVKKTLAPKTKKITTTEKKILAKKSISVSKKTNSKKSVSSPKKSVAKKSISTSKNSLTKAIPVRKTVVKKATTTKTKSTTKKYKTSLDVLSMNREVIINNKKVKLPKNHIFTSYLCVWRMYLQTNPRTKQQYVKKFWIVIGEGHKNYRKFETQEEAIRYFRNLKKYAKMKVQSANSKEFTRTIYTFFELIFRGLDIKKIDFKEKISKKSSKKNTLNESLDYEDEYTKYDLNVTNDETNTEFINEEEINKIISEKDGETVILDYKLDINDTSEYDPYDPYTKTISVSDNKTSEINNDGLDDETETIESAVIYNNDNRLFVEEEKTKKNTPNLEIKDDEIILFENPNNNFRNNNVNESNNLEKTSLYDLVSKEEKESINEILGDDYTEIEDEFKIEQHQTSTHKFNEVLDYTDEIKTKNNKISRGSKKHLLSIIVSLVSIVLIAVVVIIILIAFKIINI